jgi:hypothetical protein
LFCGALVGGYLAFRYTVFDSNLLPAWDAGWRPWHFLALRRLMLRLINAVLRSRTASAPAPYAAAPANEQFISVTIEPPAPIAPRLRLAGRMMLYRFYAFVGRQKLGWGLRRRLRAKFRRLLGSAAEPDSEARDR